MRTRGRPSDGSARPKILEARPLTRDDLAHLAPGKPRAQYDTVKRFRETHHRLARLIAFGYRYEQIADMTGYSLARIYTLGPTPAFAELVAQYRARVDKRFDEEYDDFKQTSEANLRRMERQVEAHLDAAEANDELIPLRTLAPLISDRADRFGYGKHSTQTNVNVNLATKLEQMHARSARARTIEGNATPAPAIAPPQAPEATTPPAEPSAHPTSSAASAFAAKLKSLAMSRGSRGTSEGGAIVSDSTAGLPEGSLQTMAPSPRTAEPVDG